MKTDLITLKDLSKLKLRGVDVEVICVDGHVQQISFASTDGEKFVIRSHSFLDIFEVVNHNLSEVSLDD